MSRGQTTDAADCAEAASKDHGLLARRGVMSQRAGIHMF